MAVKKQPAPDSGIRTISVAHSPDSDDAFMFYGLATGKLVTDGLKFEHTLKDIQSLNEDARKGVYDVTAISFHAYAYVADKYALLPHGASIGDNYGPIVVAREPAFSDDISKLKIAVPGTLTSAFLALRIFNADFQYEVVPFDKIIAAVQSGQCDAGLLIHEGQLTYSDDGLVKIVDLGEWWFERTGGLPLPLGGNIIRRDLGADTMRTVSAMLHDSIAHALNHRQEAVDYAQQFGRGLDRRKTDEFVGMYVNQLTLDYGARGRAGLERFFSEAFEQGLIPKKIDVEFV
jgi:1,4-dihydroxy-6-naphthoate synthase